MAYRARSDWWCKRSIMQSLLSAKWSIWTEEAGGAKDKLVVQAHQTGGAKKHDWWRNSPEERVN